MNKELYETLEMCLQALETGSDLESVLKRFPETADDLRPLLEVSQQARLLVISEVPATALSRGKARVLQYATRTRTAGFKSRKRWSLFAFPRLVISLVVALIFFLVSGTGLVRASNGALPGDNLYPVKRTWEDVRLLLVFNPEGREALQSEFEQERLQEVDKLMVEKRHETISFEGVVTEQNGNIWVVASVSVHITAASHLPQEPVTAGATVKVTGWTSTQGFVEAERVEILMPGLVVPTLAPAETEGQQYTLDQGGFEVEQGDNQGEVESESSSDEPHSTSVSGDNENSSNSDTTNSNDSGSSYDENHKDRSGNGGGSEEQNNDGSSGSSGGEHNENDSGSHD